MSVTTASCSLVCVLAVICVRGASGREARPPRDGEGPGGCHDVLADVGPRRCVLGALVMLTCGCGSTDSGLWRP